MFRADAAPRIGGKTRVCTSVSGATCEELADRARSAFEQGTDIVEFRLDLLKEPKVREISGKLSEFAPRAIFTVRSSVEGGGFRGTEPERLALLRDISDLRPAYLDVELATLDSNPGLAMGRPSEGLIVSWHDLSGTPAPELLRSVLDRARRHGALAKVVSTAVKAGDSLSILSLYQPGDEPPVAFCMGSLGLFSRVMAIHYGTPITYASPQGRQTAPGQLSINSALAFRRRLQDA